MHLLMQFSFLKIPMYETYFCFNDYRTYFLVYLTLSNLTNFITYHISHIKLSTNHIQYDLNLNVS